MTNFIFYYIYLNKQKFILKNNKKKIKNKKRIKKNN